MYLTPNARFEVALFHFRYALGDFTTMEQLIFYFDYLKGRLDRDLAANDAMWEEVDRAAKNPVS